MKRKQSQPRDESVPLTRLDLLMNAVAILIILITVLWTIKVYPSLPAKIPQHFGADGNIDSWGSKSGLWLLIGIEIVTVAALSGMCFIRGMWRPSLLNWRTNEPERALIYTRYLLGFDSMVVSGMMLYLTSATLRLQSLQGGLIWVFMALLFLSIAVYVAVLWRLKDRSTGRR